MVDPASKVGRQGQAAHAAVNYCGQRTAANRVGAGYGAGHSIDKHHQAHLLVGGKGKVGCAQIVGRGAVAGRVHLAQQLDKNLAIATIDHY